MTTINITNADSVSSSSAAHVVAALEASLPAKLEKARHKSLDKITYEFTTEPKLLEQYYKLREHCYREDLHLDDFSGAEDEYDSIGHIIVVRQGDMVVGGARLVISSPENRIRLPLEEDGFLMKDLFPELDLDNVSYCEFTRFIVSPEFREGAVCKEITRRMIDSAIQEGCIYQFSIAPLLQARNSRMIGKHLGVLHIIKNSVEVPYKSIYQNLNKQRICLAITYFFPEMLENVDQDPLKVKTKAIFETIN